MLHDLNLGETSSQDQDFSSAEEADAAPRGVERAAGTLVGVVEVVAGLLLLASVLINFANIIGRYFLSVSIPWAEEVMLFLMIGCVFLMSGVVAWRGGQIRMDALVGLLWPKLRLALETVTDAALALTSLGLAYLAYPVVAMLASYDQRSQAANIPLAIPQAALPIGFVLMAGLLIVRMLTRRAACRPAPPTIG